MKNKEIQEERMREYFIKAAMEILKGEGLVCLNVRNIADRAGYSYATLYNYFKDLKALILECVREFQAECEEFVLRKTEKTVRGKEKIQEIVNNYITYFIQYPGIYSLFFLEGMTDIGKEHETSTLIATFLDRLCQTEWDWCVTNKIMGTEDAELKKTQLRYTVSGLLLLYMNRSYPESYDAFTKEYSRQVLKILG